MSEAAPSGLLASHPDTAYFWGHVAGAGDIDRESLTVETPDEACADRLAAIAGGGEIDHDRIERPYAHDTDLTKAEDEYTVTVAGGVAAQGSAAFGLPTDGDGGYRFSALADHRRELLRGLLESCGTVCFKSSAGVVGISFVHDDRVLLETIDRLLAECPVDAPTGEISETSSGGYWFGVDDDDAAGAFGEWVYDGSDDRDLFAPTRRRKLEQSLERAATLETEPEAPDG